MFAGRGTQTIAGIGVAPPTFLEGIVGPIPSQFNIIPWGALWTNTDFTDARLNRTNVSAVASGVTDPAGTATAQKLVENSANDVHFITTISNAPGQIKFNSSGTGIEYQVAVIAKAAERTRIVIAATHASDPSNDDPNGIASAGFDLSGVQTSYSNSSTTNFTCTGSSITSLGNGWCLCKMTYTNNIAYPVVGTNLYRWKIYLDNGSDTAANSQTYTGNGTSGVLLWWWHCLPTCAWSIGTLDFIDDFADVNTTVDRNNTKSPGYNWYVNYEWPNTSYHSVEWSAGHTPPSAASTFTQVSPSILKICNLGTSQSGFNGTLWSACPTNPAGTTYTGHVWQPPFVWDAYVMFDGTYAGYQFGSWNGWVSFWTTGIEVLIQNNLDEHVELDVFESTIPFPDNKLGQSTIHHYHGLLDNSVLPNGDMYADGWTEGVYNGTFGSEFHFGEWHRISAMWLPTTLTGATCGIILFFDNGTFLGETDLAYSQGAVPQHAGAAQGARVGDIFLGESQHHQIIFDCSDNVSANPVTGMPSYWDWIRVYTP